MRLCIPVYDTYNSVFLHNAIFPRVEKPYTQKMKKKNCNLYMLLHNSICLQVLCCALHTKGYTSHNIRVNICDHVCVTLVNEIHLFLLGRYDKRFLIKHVALNT